MVPLLTPLVNGYEMTTSRLVSMVIEIRKAMRRLGLTQQEAARRAGITQPKVPDMMRGDFSNLSERSLMDCSNRLCYCIEIKVKSTSEPVGPFDAGYYCLTADV